MAEHDTAFSPKAYDNEIRRVLPCYDEWYRQIIDLVNCAFSNNVHWLDIGCGTGQMADIALQHCRVEQMVCLDRSAEMLLQARQRIFHPLLKWIEGDAAALSYSEAFDVVTAIQVFHFLSRAERETVLKRIHNALRPGGMLICFENFLPDTPSALSRDLARWKAFQLRQRRSEAEADAHLARFNQDYFPLTRTEQLTMLQAAGFSEIEPLWLSLLQIGIYAIK